MIFANLRTTWHSKQSTICGKGKDIRRDIQTWQLAHGPGEHDKL